MRVSDFMTRDPIVVAHTTSVRDARRILDDNNIRHLPVMQENRIVGIVSDRDLRLAGPTPWLPHSAYAEEAEHHTVADLMCTDIVSQRPSISVAEAAKVMYTHRIGSVLLVEEERLQGIITSSDILRAFVDLFGAQRSSTRLAVRLANQAGELVKLARVISVDMKTNIAGAVLPQVGHASEGVMVVHVETEEPERIAAALEAAGFSLEPQ